jgi:hypothetical protein
MRSKHFTLLTLLIFILTACQMHIPQPIPPPLDAEFTLEAGQSATITDTDLTIVFNSVLKDERCPSELECAASGPVTVSLAAKYGDGTVTNLTLQTFTDYNGRTPEGPFEGIEDRVELGDYLVSIKGVLPYPVESFNEIKDAQYQATFVVNERSR